VRAEKQRLTREIEAAKQRLNETKRSLEEAQERAEKEATWSPETLSAVVSLMQEYSKEIHEVISLYEAYAHNLEREVFTLIGIFVVSIGAIGAAFYFMGTESLKATSTVLSMASAVVGVVVGLYLNWRLRRIFVDIKSLRVLLSKSDAELASMAARPSSD